MKRVLIVDDEPHARQVLKTFLTNAGYSASTAINGEDALLKFAEVRPDVIITDIQMPKVSGQAFCEALAERNALADCLVVVMTSRTDPDIRSWARAMGDLQIIEKPVSPRDIIRRLAGHFSSDAQTAGAA